MLNFKASSKVLLISISFLSVTSSSPLFSSNTSIIQKESEPSPPTRAIPSFEEFDEEGKFFRYSGTLEDNIAFEIKKAEESAPLFQQILKELNVIKDKQRLLRAWPAELLNEYTEVVKKYEKELSNQGINIYEVPSSLIRRK